MLAVAFVLGACHRTAVPAATPTDLAGFRAHLVLDPDLGLAVEGSVEEARAEVVLDPAAPLTTVASGCYPSGPPSSPGAVRVPRPSGGHATLPEIWLRHARLGRLEVGGRKVALVRGRGCVLALGSDVLGPYALQVDPAARELLVSPSRPRAAYLAELTSPASASGELHAVELSRDPEADWPLLSARLRQGTASLTGPFVLSTREARSTLSGPEAERAGLVSLRAESGAPVASSPGSGRPDYVLDGLELLPGLALARVRLLAAQDWRNPGALGVLGADVWGRFPMTLDVQAGLLVLHSPPPGSPVAPEAERRLLQRPGGTRERQHAPMLPDPADEPEDPAPEP